MSFASPWLLLGLVAALIPVWLHFRPVQGEVVRFPAVLLVAQVARRRARRLELRRLVLLATRVLLFTAVVLAAARPGVPVTRAGGIRMGSSLALVVVLDDSLSMQLRDDKGVAVFERARRMALAEIDRLRPGDAVAVVLTGAPVRTPMAEMTFDASRAKRILENATPTFRRGDLPGAVRRAAEILEENPLPQQEIAVVTDLSEKPASDPGGASAIARGVGLRILDASRGIQRANTAVIEVSVAPSPEGVSRELVITAKIANHSPKPIRGIDVILAFEGVEAARGTVDIPPREVVKKEFVHRFPAEGLYHGVIRLPADALPSDDVRHFAVSVREAIRVLVIDGDFHPGGSYRDEAFYLDRALTTKVPEEVPLKSLLVDVGAAASTPLTGSDAVFLVGAQRIALTLAERLSEYVRKGGGLFVAPAPSGEGLDVLASILPGKVRSVRHAPAGVPAFRVAGINRSHSLFQPFGEGPSGLEAAEIQAHLLLEPDPAIERETLVELHGGLPLLLERRIGNGTVLLLCTTIDREWADLPIRPGFLPLVQRAARYLAHRLDDRSPRRVFVGERVPIEVSEGMQRLLVRDPKDVDFTYRAVELAGRTSVDFSATGLPGAYGVWAEIPEYGGLREIPALGFVVETDPVESDVAVAMEASAANDPSSFAPVKGSLPIWPHLLVAAFLLLLVETWLSGQGLRRSHASAAKAAKRP